MTDDADVGEPSQAARLATLEARIAQLADPVALLGLAAEIDQLGGQLVSELTRLREQPALRGPLASVLVRVQQVYARTLQRAAERFDDIGSPRRAVVVMLELLRRAIEPAVLVAVIEALAFTLEAHGQGVTGAQVRALPVPGAATGDARREARARFLAAVDAASAAIAWAALEDDLGID